MNKLTRWVDQQNEKVCLKINQIYNQKIDLGYSPLFGINPLFYPYYILRLFFIAFSFFWTNKKLTEPFSWAKLLGLRFFLKPNHGPYFYDKKVKASEVSFNTTSAPLVTIIIKSTNNHSLGTCLKSLFLNISDTYDYEVIVLSNHPENSLKETNGLVYVEGDNSYTECLATAKGKYICLLDSQTIILPMWLESLVETMEEDATVGCVGSKIYTSLGLIKYAGGIIDGKGHYYAYGDYQHPSKFNYDYKRPVDFCYQTGMMFQKADFDQLNDFDDQVYQGIDICLTIRHRLGKKIIYQPSANIIDLQKKYLAKKSDKTCAAFVAKWQTVLSKEYNFKSLEEAATRFLPKQTISVIDSYLPFFDKESGSNRLFQLLKIFQQLNYHVTFIPNDGKYVAPYYRILTAKLGIPVVYNYIGKKQFKQAIFDMINRTNILWISRPNLNLKYQYLVKYFPRIKWVYDTVDLHYVRLFRQAESETNPKIVKKALKIKKLELALASAANATIAITNIEKDVLALEGVKNLYVIPNVHDIKEVKQPFTFAERQGIVFIGGYKHKPNVDAVIWLINEIMPIVRQKLGDIPVYLLGSYPTPEVCSLNSNTVFVPGYLADVNSYFMNSRIFVAPLRYGAGMKGKIGQSLEYGLPIVSTSIGVEGMSLIDDHSVLIANDTDTFANKIIELYEDQAIWQQIKDNSLKSLIDYTPKAVSKKLQNLFDDLNVKN